MGVEASDTGLNQLEEEITHCQICPRLVQHREKVAREKRRAFRDWTYWGRPVPGFGDPKAEVLIVGLAPAAHGANRTGRIFTGDRSGDWLYRALYRAGFANQPTSTHRKDGLILTNVFVTAVIRCAPPANTPTPEERHACCPYLEQELDLLPNLTIVLALGQFAYDHMLRIYRERSHPVPSPKPRFGHLAEVDLGLKAPILLASYHPSQQNTLTGKLTEPMFDAVFRRIHRLLKRA